MYIILFSTCIFLGTKVAVTTTNMDATAASGDASITSAPSYDVTTSNITTHKNVADAEWDTEVRITILWIQIILGVIGGLVVISWLWRNRRRKSRVNVILMQVTLADILVMVASLCQVGLVKHGFNVVYIQCWVEQEFTSTVNSCAIKVILHLPGV